MSIKLIYVAYGFCVLAIGWWMIYPGWKAEQERREKDRAFQARLDRIRAMYFGDISWSECWKTAQWLCPDDYEHAWELAHTIHARCYRGRSTLHDAVVAWGRE
jgi:hypothetical protein